MDLFRDRCGGLLEVAPGGVELGLVAAVLEGLESLLPFAPLRLDGSPKGLL